MHSDSKVDKKNCHVKGKSAKCSISWCYRKSRNCTSSKPGLYLPLLLHKKLWCLTPACNKSMCLDSSYKLQSFTGTLQWRPCIAPDITQNHYLQNWNHVNTHTMWLLSTVCLLCSLLICFGCICLPLCFCSEPWRLPGNGQSECRQRGSQRMQNASSLLLKVNQTSDTPGSFDWQIKALIPQQGALEVKRQTAVGGKVQKYFTMMSHLNALKSPALERRCLCCMWC